MHFLPWWALLVGLAASAVAAYLLLGRTRAGHSPWALFALTAIAAPVVLAGAVAAAVVLSTLLSAYLEDRTAAPTGRTERTGTEAPSEKSNLRTPSEPTVTATGSPSASPSTSPTASASP